MDFDLEELVHVEQTFYDEGYRDGYAHGRIHGLIEGRALGREKGFEMWEELGFYEGFALMWAAILEKQGRRDDRAASNIRHLLDLIAQFPKFNPSAAEPSELDIPKLFRQIRSRYKALCATLGVRPTLRAGGAAGSPDGDEDPAHSPIEDASTDSTTVWKIDNKPRARGNNDLSF
ncbi:uncharacterized protein PHACADRAFT_212934 [Phanerochaete carnosa HHB-10118-sp]|uniref:Essential protein Yae1 N-terminal domain-containing protein n=1 Tax=Phanerochaete carnosa (strain HHB-10118-sp) TaxID=650164 RepID=K5VID1_PHACS|nr:uncharacterized protein PHACADRAFT_212934 [Phanerochaete carnosa HHB-10118-sp]EKM51033.1 hypothetical protein PHACADRAFT_212934 [Phanerochaete carnosa HHB-10118-sp]